MLGPQWIGLNKISMTSESLVVPMMNTIIEDVNKQQRPLNDDIVVDKASSTSWSEAVLFVERDEAFRCIAVFGNASFDATACQQALQELRKIFDKYMECPSLLDPSMESMVTTISGMAIVILLQYTSSTNTEINDDDDQAEEKEQHQNSLNQNAFLQTPLPYLLSALYALSKVRGSKLVQRFLPHEVDHVLPILTTLEHLNNTLPSTVTINDTAPTWESLYTLWNWMGMLSLVPFGLHVLADTESTIVSRLVTLATDHLAHAGAHRDMAAACLASWLSRPDLACALKDFIQWAKQTVFRINDQSSAPQQQQLQLHGFVVLGVIRTILCLLKIARCNADQLQWIMTEMWDPMTRMTDQNTQHSNNNIVLRKLVVKWWSRMACATLPPRVASWRYQRGRRSLLENLTTTTTATPQPEQPQQTTSTTTAMTDEEQNVNGSNATGKVKEEEEEDDFFIIPDQVEVAMGHLIDAITDSSTVVRWSAAKGVGRLTERLPSLCALDVLDAVLALCQDPDKDHAWHGACLTLAELARRGLLLPSHLPYVVPVIVKAIQVGSMLHLSRKCDGVSPVAAPTHLLLLLLFRVNKKYDVQRGNTSVGSAVRDAACYTYWAFARAYSPDVLRPFLHELSQSVVVTSLFDREVNCRRAASAAFQECVGRQGANVSPCRGASATLYHSFTNVSSFLPSCAEL
jgi:hypothetical protein